MSQLVVRRLPDTTPGHVLALQRHLLGLSVRARATDRPVLLLAECAHSGVVLGHYQSFDPGCTDPPPPAVHRRQTGGRATAIGPGILWVTVILPALTELTTPNPRPITPDRALNRYCRGILRGLASLGVPAFYPGQDSITVRRRPLALLSADVTPHGPVLFECFIAVNRSVGALQGDLFPGEAQAPSTLNALAVTTVAGELGRGVEVAEVMAAICRGYEDQSQMTLNESAANPLEAQLLDAIEAKELRVPGWVYGGIPGPDHDLHTSVEVTLGRFEVGCALQQRHFLSSVTFAGDFIATGGIIPALEKKLRLCPTEWKAIGIATDQAFQEPHRAILGIGPRQTIPNTIMQAIESALPQPAGN